MKTKSILYDGVCCSVFFPWGVLRFQSDWSQSCFPVNTASILDMTSCCSNNVVLYVRTLHARNFRRFRTSRLLLRACCCCSCCCCCTFLYRYIYIRYTARRGVIGRWRLQLFCLFSPNGMCTYHIYVISLEIRPRGVRPILRVILYLVYTLVTWTW